MLTCVAMCVGIALVASRRACAAEQGAITTRDLLVHGSPTMYWIAAVEQENAAVVSTGGATAAQTASPLRTLIRARPMGSNDWKEIARLNGRVVSLADRGSQLAALLESGDWMLLWDGGSTTGTQPTDGARLFLFASGPKDQFWGLASARTGPPPSTRGSTQPAATMPAGTRLLYKLTSDGWELAAPLPDTTLSPTIALAVFPDNKPAVAFLADGDVRVIVWDDAADKWQSLGDIDLETAPTRIKLLSDLGSPALWVGGETGAGRLFTWREGKWTGVDLVLPAGGEFPEKSPRDITVAGEALRLVVAGEKARLTEFTFAPNGQPRGGTPLPVAQVPVGLKPYDWGSGLTFALLAMLMFNAFFRRGTTPAESVEAAGLVLAPVGRRLLAGIIDASPILGTILVVSAQLASDGFDLRSLESGDNPLLENTAVWIALFIYVLHTMVSEALWGWTIGKRLMGLRVVMLDGSPAPFWPIFIRNALRVVDVLMAFTPALLALLPPLRQRLGDLIADTVVISGRLDRDRDDAAGDARDSRPDDANRPDGDGDGDGG
jgi:uncharacterized RDD family membrane protein YckC